MAKKTGIGPILASVVPGLISGLFKKKDRDSETPKAAGIVRDVGVTAMLASGGSMVAQNQGLIDCATYGLSDEYCGLVHGIALLAGFIMFALGIGQKKESKDGGLRKH